MKKTQSVVSLDPIDRSRKKADSPIARIFKTRHYFGKGVKRTDEFGHYLFVGRQRGGKTVSMLWYYELIRRKYEKKNKRITVFLTVA